MEGLATQREAFCLGSLRITSVGLQLPPAGLPIALSCPPLRPPEPPWPAPQSQLDFASLGGDLLLEIGAGLDPLGLLSPLHRPGQQPLRPGSGLSTARHSALLHGASASSAGGSRPAPAAHSQAQQASSMITGRRSDAGDANAASFLRSPGIGGGTPRVPALFKSPEEQGPAGLQSLRGAPATAQQPHRAPQPRRPSLFSPAAFSAHGASPAPGGGGARSSTRVEAVAAAAPGGGGGAASRRTLVTVQTGRLDSLDNYLAEVG